MTVARLLPTPALSLGALGESERIVAIPDQVVAVPRTRSTSGLSVI